MEGFLGRLGDDALAACRTALDGVGLRSSRLRLAREVACRSALLGKGGSGGRAASARGWQDRATTGESDGGRLLGDLVRALPVLDAPPAEPVERVPAARRRALFSRYGRSWP